MSHQNVIKTCYVILDLFSRDNYILTDFVNSARRLSSRVRKSHKKPPWFER